MPLWTFFYVFLRPHASPLDSNAVQKKHLFPSMRRRVVTSRRQLESRSIGGVAARQLMPIDEGRAAAPAAITNKRDKCYCLLLRYAATTRTTYPSHCRRHPAATASEGLLCRREGPKRDPNASSKNARLRWGLVTTSVWLCKPRSHGRKKEATRARNGAPLPGRPPSFRVPHRSASSALCPCGHAASFRRHVSSFVCVA